jgi:hypothetical protein
LIGTSSADKSEFEEVVDAVGIEPTTSRLRVELTCEPIINFHAVFQAVRLLVWTKSVTNLRKRCTVGVALIDGSKQVIGLLVLVRSH